jgi:site-specific DNA-cytosine methylase
MCSRYPFPSTLVKAYRLIGDAVPFELARIIGESIAEQIGVGRSLAVAAVAGD